MPTLPTPRSNDRALPVAGANNDNNNDDDDDGQQQTPTRKTVLVIGAGVAGVATACVLTGRGCFHVTVYERSDRLGGVWAHPYPGATVQTSPQQYEFPDQRYPNHIRQRPSALPPTAAEVRNYLRDYCDRHGLPLDCIHLGVTVRHVTLQQLSSPHQTMTSSSWNVTSDQRGTELFDYVVLCTGLFSTHPNIISLPGRDEFERAGGTILHTSEWKTSADRVLGGGGRRVLVVGNGKSAADAAVAAARMAELQEDGASPPVQVIRRANWYVPRLLLRHFKWAFHSRFVAALLPVYFENQNPVVRALHVICAPFKWCLWRLLEVIFLLLLRLPYRLWPRLGTLDTEGSLSVPLLVTDDRHLRRLRTGLIDQRVGTVQRLSAGMAHLSNGDRVPVDTIVLGTGWTPVNYYQTLLDQTTILPKLQMASDGLWLYRNIVPPQLPRIAWIGANALTFMNPYTSFLQAQWLMSLWTKQRPSISEKIMMETVASEQKFKRALYPECPLRGATIEAYMQHYHDTLLRELEVEPHVYSFALLNWFLPILPETMATTFDTNLRTQQLPGCSGLKYD